MGLAEKIKNSVEAEKLLIEAIKDGNLAAAEKAISRGANPIKGGYKLFEFSVRNGRKEIEQSIIKQATKQDLNSFIKEAAIKHQLVVVLDLQKHGARIRIDERFVKEYPNVLLWIRMSGINAQVMYEAFVYAERNCPDALKTLITIMRKSEEPQKYQRNMDFLAHESARKGKLNLIKYYEEEGADVRTISPMDIEFLKKKGEGTIINHLRERGVKIGRLL